MKKSNKLLSAGFLAGLLLVTIMHVTLYARYKNGNYTIYNVEDELTSYSMQSFPHILFVSVRNVPEATVTFGDIAQAEKDEQVPIRYVQSGDTLLITGRDSSKQQDIQRRAVLRLPYNATLSVFNSSLSFQPGKNPMAGSPVIYLQRSRALFSATKDLLRFDRVKITAADSSTASFRGNVQVNDLDVELSHSAIEYADGDVGQLSIATDPSSRISLLSKFLSKAKITNTAQE